MPIFRCLHFADLWMLFLDLFSISIIYSYLFWRRKPYEKHQCFHKYDSRVTSIGIHILRASNSHEYYDFVSVCCFFMKCPFHMIAHLHRKTVRQFGPFNGICDRTKKKKQKNKKEDLLRNSIVDWCTRDETKLIPTTKKNPLHPT